MLKNDIKDMVLANKAAWDASAPLHEVGPAWETLLATVSQPGFSVLDSCLTATLQEIGIGGRRSVQIGCNNARELLSLAAFGADPVLGIDQSSAFLAQGETLARAAGLHPRLLEANIYDLPKELGTFDFVLITVGVLNWMPDLPRFFDIVAHLMAPGAVLVIYETHPFLEMFDPNGKDPHELVCSYFDRSPQESFGTITYDGNDGGGDLVSYWFLHSLGDIVTACVQAGLGLEKLVEHPHSNREVDYDIYAGRAAQLPMSYTVVARAR
ncbi:class I SAM-dependent methyltransferase [Roseospira marina]|uniref:Class I SAM-dependent methyltransferase n=1 Tax=Roseospira marina TaxID=140057 RepID=A0A5M6I7S9_9PROT|nr:class I SAM-dependent methyltransferase [Roseospira marina]KAA5603808.1 class I SAM-dependent methyltransferase [Roseospira marina]MBB4316019.1 SAM-dependent methyltransferase [Roseospira marina]MBB5089185.1 SAM-dependent methyltransferase [Roseospira marina]